MNAPVSKTGMGLSVHRGFESPPLRCVLDQHHMIGSVRELVVTSWPQRFVATDLPDDVSLGETGLGLDSVEIAELLMACEDRFGRPVGPELFALVPLTIAGVAEYFA